MFDQKDLELLLEKLKIYRDYAWERVKVYKDRGPEWREYADRYFGEATGYEMSIILVRKLLRGDEL